MKRNSIFLILLVVLAASAFFVFKEKAHSPDLSADAADISIANQVDPETLAPAPSHSESADLEREILPQATAPINAEENILANAGSGEKAQYVFRGRVIGKEDGQPLEGIAIQLRGRAGNRNLAEKYGDPRHPVPEPFVTGPDGQFQIEYPVTPAYLMTLNIRGEGRVQLDKSWSGGWTEAKLIDFGDLMMQPGKLVFGIVRTQDGQPVPNFPLQLKGIQQDVKGFDAGYFYTRSKDDGSFQFASAAPPGHWTLEGNGQGHLLESPRVVEVPQLGSLAALNVIAKSMPSISGVVVNEDGVGIERAMVETIREGGGMGEYGRTDENGRFEVFARRENLEAVPLTVEAEGYLPFKSNATYGWGSAEAEIALIAGHSFEVLVLAKETQTPVEKYHVRCFVNQSPNAQAVPGPIDGVTTLVGLPIGTADITIVPVDPGLDLVGPIELQITTDMENVVVELPSMPLLNVRVVDFAGEAVDQATVYVLDRAPWEERPGIAFDPRGYTTVEVYGAGLDIPTLRSRALTGPDGRTQVGLPAEAEQPFVQIKSSGMTTSVMIPLPPSDDELVITLPALGGIRGVLGMGDFPHGTVGLDFFSQGRGRQEGRRESQLLQSDVLIPNLDGGFYLADVKPGNYTVRLAIAPSETEVAAGATSWWLHPDVLQRFEVRSGEETFLELDASTRPLGSMRVRAYLDGELAAGRKISFRWKTETRGGVLYSVADEQGELHLEALPIGEYIGQIQSGEYWIEASGELLVTAGNETSATLEAHQKEVLLRLVDEDGKELPEGYKVVVEPYWDKQFTVAAGGLIKLDPAPLMIVHIYAGKDGERSYQGGAKTSLGDVEPGATVTVALK